MMLMKNDGDQKLLACCLMLFVVFNVIKIGEENNTDRELNIHDTLTEGKTKSKGGKSETSSVHDFKVVYNLSKKKKL